jgi:Domain of unknown function (DUF4845)
VCRSGQSRRLAGSRESDSHIVATRQRQLPARLSQAGNSRLKLIAFLTVGLAMIYLGIKVIPILVNNLQFQDAIESTARFASVNRQSPEDIRAAVLKQAQEVDIPITAKDIQVRGEGGHVEIAADYSVTVDLGVYQWTPNFHPYAKNNPLL